MAAADLLPKESHATANVSLLARLQRKIKLKVLLILPGIFFKCFNLFFFLYLFYFCEPCRKVGGVEGDVGGWVNGLGTGGST